MEILFNPWTRKARSYVFDTYGENTMYSPRKMKHLLKYDLIHLIKEIRNGSLYCNSTSFPSKKLFFLLIGFGLIYISLKFVVLHRMIFFPKWREISWKFVFRGELDYNQYQLKYLEGKQPKHRSLQISLEYIDQSSDESTAFAW